VGGISKKEEVLMITTIGRTYADVFKEVVESAKNLVQSETRLMRSEIDMHVQKAKAHTTQLVVFAALMILSVLPFLAFLVIGLGEILDDRYWLSSLIVALACAGIGGVFAYRAFRKLKGGDLELPETKESLDKSVATLQQKAKNMSIPSTGGLNEPARSF
jgi:hypothetical protein